jgi:hypothetical protein
MLLSENSLRLVNQFNYHFKAQHADNSSNSSDRIVIFILPGKKLRRIEMVVILVGENLGI